MSARLAISVQGVSKKYRMWGKPASRLTSPMIASTGKLFPTHSNVRRRLQRIAESSYRDFWALRDISFDVRPGEAVGIIGRNGSGKSTLLQIIAGTLQPTAGTAEISGRVAALLELGSGFNPDFTGRENVYLNAAVLGLARREVDMIYDEIVSFADIGDFIDEPVKTYSSGMMMRLAFAIQTGVKPEVLIVDEALSVGDAAFVAKCINRVSQFINGGGTLLFVSHEIGLVKQLTSRAIYLERGSQVAFGPTTEVALAYTNALGDTATTPTARDPDRFASATAPFAFREVELRGHPTPNLAKVARDAALQIDVGLTGGPARTPSRLIFSLYNYMGLIVFSGEVPLPTDGREGPCRVVLDFPKIRLCPGAYRMNFAIRCDLEIAAWLRNALVLNVEGSTTETFIYREEFRSSFDRSI